MRIAQFSDSFIPIMDGVGRVVYNYAIQLGEKGHDCYVMTPMTDTGFRGGFPFEIVDFIGVPMPMMKQYKVGVPAEPHYQSRLDKIDVDIVHVHSPFMAGQSGMHFAKKRGLPIVGTFHSKYYDDFLQVTGMELLADLGVKYVVDFYEKCDEVWAVSHSSADTLRSYGYKGDVIVMPNGTDIRTPKPGSRQMAVERFGLPENGPVLLFVGQMNWKKNIICVLEAAADLMKKGVDFKLAFAGRGPHEQQIKDEAHKLGLDGCAVYCGHIEDIDLLDGLYQRASIFVFPSIYDNGPMVVREAASMGTPAVVVAGSSAAECVEDGRNGFLCENESKDLADVLDKALSDMDRLSAIGAEAKRTIPKPWSELIDNVVDRYAGLVSSGARISGKTQR